MDNTGNKGVLVSANKKGIENYFRCLWLQSSFCFYQIFTRSESGR